MSKPTLEERVAALEKCVFLNGHSGDDHSRIQGTPGGNELAYTSDPQEPYRLDTKPKPLMTIDLDSRIVLGDTESRSAAENFRRSSWNMDFDPKASPRNVPFSVALEYMAIGRKASRLDGREGETFYIKDRRFCSSRGHTLLSEEDILAKDWWIVPEP